MVGKLLNTRLNDESGKMPEPSVVESDKGSANPLAAGDAANISLIVNFLLNRLN